MRDILNYDKNNDDDGDGDEKKEKNTLNKSKMGSKRAPELSDCDKVRKRIGRDAV